MSFILEDPQLVKALLRYAQAVPTPAISPQDVSAVRTLISNLRQKLTGGPTAAEPEITTGSGQNAPLTSLNMKNLSSLVNWLGMNGIKINGKNIVVGADELPNDPSYVPYQFEGDQAFRPATTLTFKVNRELLSQYLHSLVGQVLKSGNPVMKAQVEAMVNESNEQLDTNITQYQTTQTLDPNFVIDKLPQRILTNAPPYGDGTIELKYGDLADYTNLNAWVQDNKITVNDQSQVDRCALLKFLHARAANQIQNAHSQQAAAVAKLYRQALEKIAPAFKCDLGSATKPGTTQSSGQPVGTSDAATLAQLVDILPLQSDVLDFGRIRDFINHYRSLLGAGVDPIRLQSDNVAMDQAEQYMQGATRNTLGQSMTTFSMDGLSATDLIEWATPPNQDQPIRARGSALALANFLEQVVRQVYTIIKHLYDAHYSELTTDPRLSSANVAIQQQVGGPSIPFGSSLASSNIDDIQTARARLPQAGANE